METFLQFHPKVLNVEVKVIIGNAYDVWMILNIYLNKSIQIDTIESYIYAYIYLIVGLFHNAQQYEHIYSMLLLVW